ncbi:aminotransferase class IV [Oceaniglobus trochenteri]|uniref:aminotransferase class IV n=1 Tax=Oceaniglobus trochenteri TaxID=2763260 RepID=UPI001CFF70DC|nr:aminotransferase class IV [Oceaniglobus trochenteri]
MTEQLVYINGDLVTRENAKISVWDRGFQSGDGVYEGLRVYNGGVFRLHEHVARLIRCAHALRINLKMTHDDICKAILKTVEANGLTSDAHIRITLTRGDKPTTGMDTKIGEDWPPCLVIIIEPKKPSFPKDGLRLITSSVRRMPAQCLDPKLHTLNQLGQIMAKIEANNAGANEAIMLDMQGFVAETNSANLFMIEGDTLRTPKVDALMPGLTRGYMLKIAADFGLKAVEDNISLGDLYCADEVFMTGTVCEIVPVTEIDGRRIGAGKPGPRTLKLLERYLETANSEVTRAAEFA